MNDLRDIVHDLSALVQAMEGLLALQPTHPSQDLLSGQVEYLGALTNQLRRSVTERLVKPTLAPLDAVPICVAAVAMATATARPRRITVMLEVETTRVDVWGEATALRRVLDNLLGNAIAVTPSGGLVQLRVEMGTGITTFVVSDSGVGLSDEQKTRIFDPLVSYRGGTGLGLAIVRDLVTTLGGNISVSSEIGVGSSFTVDLLATTQG